MERRGFLSLLLAAPLVPALAKVATLVEPSIVIPATARFERFALPFAPADGFSFDIAAGAIGKFISRPQLTFRPDRLLLNGAEDVSLLGVSAAGEPQIEDEVPAYIFHPSAFATRLAFDVISPGYEIVLAVHNRGKTATHFGAMMLGNAVREPPFESDEKLADLAGWPKGRAPTTLAQLRQATRQRGPRNL